MGTNKGVETEGETTMIYRQNRKQNLGGPAEVKGGFAMDFKEARISPQIS